MATDQRCRAVASAPDHMDEQPARGRYHPFEEIAEAVQLDDGEPAHLTDAESARTIVEVNHSLTNLKAHSPALLASCHSSYFTKKC